MCKKHHGWNLPTQQCPDCLLAFTGVDGTGKIGTKPPAQRRWIWH